MEEAGGVDLARFRRWYGQAGTPRVAVAVEHEAGGGRATVRLAQRTLPHARPARQAAARPAAAHEAVRCRDRPGSHRRAAGAVRGRDGRNRVRGCHRAAGAVDQPRLLRPRHHRERPGGRRPRVPVGARRRSVRALRGGAAADARHAGGGRGGGEGGSRGGARRGDADARRHAVGRRGARSGVRGGGGAAAVGELRRRPDGDRRSRRDLPRARGAAPRSRPAAGRAVAGGCARPRPSPMAIRPRARASAGCARSRSAIWRRAGRPTRPTSPSASSRARTT